MSIVSYSQNFEDVLLWRAVGHVQNGRYIDIGAQDPDIDSVSRAFYERGWRGVSVEPLPSYADRLRAVRPDETLIQAVVTEAPGPLPFFEIANTGLSTLSRDIAEEHRAKGFTVTELLVSTTTLDAILDSQGGAPVHWLKIDVEGAERDVLKSWKHSVVTPWVVVVEATYPNSPRQTHAEWEELILAKNYRLAHWDGLNRYYVAPGQEALIEVLAAGPNYWDAFQLTDKSWATRDMAADAIRLRHQLSIAEQENIRISRSLTDLESRYRQIEEQKAASEATCQAAESARERISRHALAVQARLIARHERTLSDHRKSWEVTLARSVEEVVSERNYERARFEQEATLRSQLEERLALAHERVRMEVDKCTRHVEDIATLREALDQERSSHGKTQNELVLAHNSLRQALRVLSDLRETHEQIESELAEKISPLEKELAIEREALKSILERLSELSQEIAAARKAHLEEVSAHEEVRNRLTRAHLENERSNRAIEDLRANLDKLELTLSDRDSELLNARAETVSLQETIRRQEATAKVHEDMHKNWTQQQGILEHELSRVRACLSGARSTLFNRLRFVFGSSPSTDGTAIENTLMPVTREQGYASATPPGSEVTTGIFDSAGTGTTAYIQDLHQEGKVADNFFDDEQVAMTLDKLLTLPAAAFVQNAYRLVLDRDADPIGLRHYVTRLAFGHSRTSVLLDLSDSDEGKRKARFADLAGVTDDEFVEILYQRVLQRSADPSGKSHYLALLKKYGSRVRVATDIENSTEARERLGDAWETRRHLALLLKQERRRNGLLGFLRSRHYLETRIGMLEALIEQRLDGLKRMPPAPAPANAVPDVSPATGQQIAPPDMKAEGDHGALLPSYAAKMLRRVRLAQRT